MNNYRLITLVCALLLFPLSAEAMTWHGLVPLHSNRKDVERELGKPIRSDDSWMIYEFEREDVSIYLSATEDCSGEPGKPGGTIVYIEVSPRTPQRLSDLAIDEKMIRKYGPSGAGFVGFTGYIDNDQGLAIRADEKNVGVIYYLGIGEERSSCPSYYPDPKELVDVPFCFLCPTISVASPDEAEAGSVVAFTASIGVGHPRPTTIKWTVSAGTIISGQGTPYIEVDTSKAEGKEIYGTIEVRGWDRTCGNRASTTTKITKRKNN